MNSSLEPGSIVIVAGGSLLMVYDSSGNLQYYRYTYERELAVVISGPYDDIFHERRHVFINGVSASVNKSNVQPL